MYKRLSVFFLKLGGLSILILLSCNVAQYSGVQYIYLPTIYWIVGFFFILFSIVHFALLTTSTVPEKFVNTVMFMMTLKLFFSLFFIVLLSFFYRDNLVVSAVQFSLLYLVFMLFDVLEVRRFLNESRGLE